MSDGPDGGQSRARPELVIASSNAGKQREFREILALLPGVRLRLRGLHEFDAVAFPEEGRAYEPNAVAKARAVFEATGRAALADDSGLEVDALDGAPGPLSARFGGAGLDDRGRTANLLEALAGCDERERTARFVCVAALVDADGRTTTARGECPGRILHAPHGEGGFGYDPVFEVEPGVSMAELPAAEKNARSHRALALRALAPALAALARRA